MFCQEARNLILLFRRGSHGNFRAKELIEKLKKKEVTVITSRRDVISANSFVSVLMNCDKEMPSIQECIQKSMVLKVSKDSSILIFSSNLKY